ncbi:MAG: hypothetical protein OSA48_09295 [Akkermansiaceae bacterium]|nr:hypothetical protein [Akkermansiaceae bacterium]
MPARLLIALLPLLLAACTDLGHLKKEALAGTPTPRLLTLRETNALAHAWRKSGFASNIDGYSIEFQNSHPNLPSLTQLIRGNEIRTRLPHQSNSIGIPTLAGSGPPQWVSVRLTPHAHQLTLQPATFVARQIAPDKLRIELHDPRVSSTLGGRPLARADRLLFDYVKREQAESLLSLRGLLSPSDYANRRGFYLSTPYDRSKTPVVFIHGLASSPLAFREIISHLQRDPALWKRYQFWFYFYPTGEPWLNSAGAFRRDLTELITAIDPDSNDSHLHDMVLVAHSMGGLISRASVSLNSTALYQSYFQRDLQNLRLTTPQKNRLAELLLYKPIPWPRRIIFLSTPHQGSRLAEGPLEWVARQVIRTPGRILEGTLLTTELLASGEPGILTSDAFTLLRNGQVSVSQLDPNNPAIKSLQKMPLRADVTTHSIIGDLGGPRHRLGTDGVVPYTSAHLPDAKSELIIRSHHGTTNKHDTAVEVARILRSAP